MDWERFRFFLAVAKHQTLKKAAEALKVDQATVGRNLNSLQASLGVQLLEKRSDGYFLTNAGFRVMDPLRAIEEGFAEVDRLIAGADERPVGLVKIALPGALANHWVIQALGPLLEEYSGLEIQFLTGAEVVNLARREADLALRLVRPTQKDLKARKLGPFRLGLYGAKKFAAHPEKAPFVGLVGKATSDLEKDFLRSLPFAPQYRIRSEAWSSVMAGLQSGIGVGILPEFMGKKSGLAEILMHKDSTPLWMVVHPEIAGSMRVKLVSQFLGDLFSKAL